MARRTTITLMILGLGLAPSAASAAEGTITPKVEAAKDAAATVTREMSDSWITLKTKLGLLADERVSSLDIHVTTQKGAITLSGKVNSEGARQAAEEIALNVEGQKKVINHLAVVPAADRKVVERQDDQIVRDVERRLKGDAGLRKTDIEVRSDNGIVTLTGQATSLETSVRASEVARRAPGVRAVRNELTIEPKG